MDLFKTAEDVLITIKSCLDTYTLTKNQTKDITTDRDTEQGNVMRLESKNGKKWKITIEEEK